MAQGPGLCHAWWVLELGSLLLALTWLSCCCCGHLGADAWAGTCLCPPVNKSEEIIHVHANQLIKNNQYILYTFICRYA